MANKQVNELSTIPSVVDSDLFPIYDGSEGGSEKLKKITAANLGAYVLTTFSPGDITSENFIKTDGLTASIFNNWTEIQALNPTSEVGGIFQVQAGCIYRGSGSGEFFMRITIDGTEVARTGMIEFNTTTTYGGDGGATLFFAFDSVASQTYDIDLDVTTQGAGESVQCEQRYILVTEHKV